MALANSAADGDSVEFDGHPRELVSLMTEKIKRPKGVSQEKQIAGFIGAKLALDTRLASFSINGWDTHVNQEAGRKRGLRKLSDSILALQGAAGGGAWQNTTVIAMT